MRAELTEEHLPHLTALVNAIESHDKAPFRTLPSELAEYFEPGFDRRTIGVLNGDELIAFGVVRMPHDGGNLRFSGGVHPAHRGQGLGAELMEWSEQAARDLAGDKRDAVLETYVEEGRDELGELLDGMGFAPTHGFVTLRRDLSGPITPVEIPAFFHVIPFTELDDDLASSYLDQIKQGGMAVDPTFFKPEWSFVIVDKTTDRTALAGYIVSNAYPQDWDVTGWTEGFTETVAVQPEYRGSHLASRLLYEAALAYRNDGMGFAGVEVDVDGEGKSPIMSFFTGMGYAPIRRTYTWTRRVYPLDPVITLRR